MHCQWPTEEPCKEEVVAKIGIPSANAMWVCKAHFDEWQNQASKAKESADRGNK